MINEHVCMELPILIWNIYPDFEHPFQLID